MDLRRGVPGFGPVKCIRRHLPTAPRWLPQPLRCACPQGPFLCLVIRNASTPPLHTLSPRRERLAPYQTFLSPGFKKNIFWHRVVLVARDVTGMSSGNGKATAGLTGIPGRPQPTASAVRLLEHQVCLDRTSKRPGFQTRAIMLEGAG